MDFIGFQGQASSNTLSFIGDGCSNDIEIH